MLKCKQIKRSYWCAGVPAPFREHVATSDALRAFTQFVPTVNIFCWRVFTVGTRVVIDGYFTTNYHISRFDSFGLGDILKRRW